jgi:tRNA (adenine57-N1/adenine58-N1)-methyltransferase
MSPDPDAAADAPSAHPATEEVAAEAGRPTSPAPAADDVEPEVWSGVHRGPLRAGEWVRLTDTKGRRHNLCLEAGRRFFTNKGSIDHDDLIGRQEGFSISSSAGGQYLVFRPLLNEFVVSMPRGAAVVYPKDAAQIVAMADIFPGARVVEAGVGSGALTCSLLRAVGPQGAVSSFERRPEFAEVAERNVTQFFGGTHPAWSLTVGDLAESLLEVERAGSVDRVILDMLAPWECVAAVADALTPGGVICVYVATTTQLGRVVEAIRAHGGFTEPQPWETLVRDWHVEGLAIRPGHKMIGHTGFLVTARRMAPGETAPKKKRRPAPGAYGKDYQGPRPTDLPPQIAEEPYDA